MALSGTGPALGVALAAAAGSTDIPGLAAWGLIGTSICAQLPALTVFSAIGGTPLVSAGGVIAGTGALTMTNGSVMGPGLAAAAGSVDPAGITKWTAIGKAITDWMAAQGKYNTGFIGYIHAAPPPGPVTGTGTIVFDQSPGTTLAAAAGVGSDPAGITAWTAIGNALKAHLETNLQLAPTSLVNPGPGGPVTGSATTS